MSATGSPPLAGRRIVVTRPEEHASHLAGLLRAEGATVAILPTVDIVALAPGPALREVAATLEDYALAIFVSRTAVREGLGQCEALRAGRAWPSRLRWATVGQGTRRELEARGCVPVIAPEGAADSEALLALPALAEVRGWRIALFRGEGGRTLIADTLAARGALVTQVPCYRRAPPADPEAFAAAWRAGPVDAVTISSGEGLANLLALLDRGALARAGLPFFLPHARVAAQARNAGLEPIVVAGTADAQVRDALVAYFNPSR